MIRFKSPIQKRYLIIRKVTRLFIEINVDWEYFKDVLGCVCCYEYSALPTTAVHLITNFRFLNETSRAAIKFTEIIIKSSKDVFYETHSRLKNEGRN